MELKVIYEGREVGRLRYVSGIARFAYSRDWLNHGFSISPKSLPLEDRLFSARPDIFGGLHGVFADSLPGGWGMLTAIRALRKKGIDYLGLDPLGKLSYIGKDGIGALSYEPTNCDWDSLPEADTDRLCMECMAVSEGRDPDLDDVFRRAGSTGGARPKMNLEIGGESWIVKFRERYDPESAGRMEFEYNQAASKCGIDIPECRLIPSELCDGFFASKRFDRAAGKRIHMISLGGLLDIPRDMPILDYLTFLQATRFVTGSQTEVVKAFRLACFNVFAKNYDDHSGNFSFVYNEDADRYALSPAYDLTRTPNMREHHMTCMGNPLPGEKELLQLASRMDIPGARAKEIVTQVGDTVRAELSEWLSGMKE